MSSIFQSLKDKAQSAVSSSGLADHLPGGFSRTDGKTSPTGGMSKSHTLESLHHQLRSFQQQFSSSTTPAQRIITGAKGVALDYDAVAHDLQGYSKEMYLWGQTDAEDIRDVTDRLGWLNYVHGSLAAALAQRMDAARSPFKALRDAENVLAPRRNVRNGLQSQIARMEYDQYDRRDPEKQQRIRDMKAQLQRAEASDEAAEKDIEILKRKAVRESEQLKWEAIKEYAEKLSMVAQAAIAVTPALPPVPPSPSQPYNGGDLTASVRASLQHALDNYTPGNTNFFVDPPLAGDLKHTRSFGQTHEKELSRIGSGDGSTGIPLTPPLSGATAQPGPSYSPQFPQPMTSPSSLKTGFTATSQSTSPPLATAPSPLNMSPPLNPTLLNQAPAPLPSPQTSTYPLVASNSADPASRQTSSTRPSTHRGKVP
ncbi:hypothetical protein NM688_g5048 [Phlebia brevispora]|uniref:Uncharacterized protein n=1 Tax=Phlebia brevispora TaxID=194682 RepID=A0ACC1T178_9APHY|nr:hypothetical protein NM688_g5048 [Phlebia brevispora]